MARIKCPFCVKPLDPTALKGCPSCGEALPLNFVRDCRNAPPLWMVTSGFSQHGKTTLLHSIILMLENIDRKLEGFHLRWLDQATHEALQRMRTEALEGKAPAATQPGRPPRPLLLRVQNAPAAAGPGGTENHTLVAYDLPGELFASLDELDVPALREVQTVWLMVSPFDLANDREGNTLPGLYQAYEAAMSRLGASMKGRNLIVVYTKGDKFEFGPELAAFLTSDPFQDLTLDDDDNDDEPLDFSLPAYVAELERVSELLAKFTRRKIKGGSAFTSMVKESGLNLRFCLTSASGDPDQNNRYQEQSRHYRVLDPLFWTLWLGQRGDDRGFGLVLDALTASGAVDPSGAAAALWDALGDQGDVTTYVLGQSRPVGLPGQRPSPTAPRSLPRLIGPALERAGGSGPFLVVTTGPILDLADFLQAPWRDRILLVTLGPVETSWPHIVAYQPGDDPVPLVRALLDLNR